MSGRAQVRQRHLDQPLDFRFGDAELGTRRGDADDRMQQVAADTGMCSGVSRPSTSTAAGGDADFLVRLAQRRLLRSSRRHRRVRPAATPDRCGGAAPTPRSVSGSVPARRRADRRSTRPAASRSPVGQVTRDPSPGRGRGAMRSCASSPGSGDAPGARAARRRMARIRSRRSYSGLTAAAAPGDSRGGRAPSARARRSDVMSAGRRRWRMAGMAIAAMTARGVQQRAGDRAGDDGAAGRHHRHDGRGGAGGAGAGRARRSHRGRRHQRPRSRRSSARPPRSSTSPA